MTRTSARSVTRQGRVLRCVLSTAAHGASLDFAAVQEVTAAVRAPDAGVGAVLLVGRGRTSAPAAT